MDAREILVSMSDVREDGEFVPPFAEDFAEAIGVTADEAEETRESIQEQMLDDGTLIEICGTMYDADLREEWEREERKAEEERWAEVEEIDRICRQIS